MKTKRYFYFLETFTDKNGVAEFERHCRSYDSAGESFTQNDGGVFTYKRINPSDYINGYFKYLNESTTN